MSLVHPRSLAATVHTIEDAFREKATLSTQQRREAARWLVGRQDLPGSYAHMPAVTDRERRQGAPVYTGERMTHASCRHILGEEACRALLLLAVKDPAVSAAFERAAQGILAALRRGESSPCTRLGDPAGCFCCGKCSVAVWRHLTAGGLDQPEKRLAAGLASLKYHRDGNGRWRIYPFHYTLLALVDMPLLMARDELRYAASTCEAIVRRNRRNSLFDRRRVKIAQEALARA